MRHAKPSSAWRPVRAQPSRYYRAQPQGVLTAFAFNVLLFLLPLASAAALIVIARDHLYAYEYSETGARNVAARVERINGELIQVDFDRQRQWDDLVAMELMAGDFQAARGFLLSGAGMLPSRISSVLKRAADQNAGDAPVEAAALELLQPSTRTRYHAAMIARGEAEATPTSAPVTIADPQDFQLMARALLSEPETDPLQFILTGFSLGLAGDLTPSLSKGAAVLLATSRRDDYPHALADEIHELFRDAAPIEAFRAAAMESASGEDVGSLENISAAFTASVNAERAARAREVLTQIGDMAEATSPVAASLLLTHASAVRDVPRLRLLAQAAGDRAIAAAKRLPRDGRLLDAARGELTMNRDLVASLTVTAAALFGLILLVVFKLFQALTQTLTRYEEEEEDDYGAELVDISTNNWRPL